MYLSETRLTNLVLTKAVFQLLRLEKHTPRMQPRGVMFSEITFTNLSGTLLHNETIKGHVISYLVSPVYLACSQYDFKVVIGENRKFEENKSFIYKISFEYNQHDIFEH